MILYRFLESFMRKIGVSELRQHLPGYLARVRKGEPIQITQHGKVVARLVPEQDPAEVAREKMAAWAKTAKIGDVKSPSGEVWTADADNL
jgi:prevent-host-death family protein